MEVSVVMFTGQRTHTVSEIAMEKVTQQVYNAHRGGNAAAVWHLRLTAGESRHDEHDCPRQRVATISSAQPSHVAVVT